MSDIIKEELERSRYRAAVRKVAKKLYTNDGASLEDVRQAQRLAPPEHAQYWVTVADALASGHKFRKKTYPVVFVPTKLVEEIEKIFVEEHSE